MCTQSCRYISLQYSTYCCSFHGSSLWNLSACDVNKLYIAWNKAIRRLLNIPYNTHTKLLPVLVNSVPVTDQLFKRFASLYINMLQCDNKRVAFLARRASCNVRGIIGSNVAAFCLRYDTFKQQS